MNPLAIMLAIENARRSGFNHFAAALAEVLRRELARTKPPIPAP